MKGELTLLKQHNNAEDLLKLKVCSQFYRSCTHLENRKTMKLYRNK